MLGICYGMDVINVNVWDISMVLFAVVIVTADNSYLRIAYRLKIYSLVGNIKMI